VRSPWAASVLSCALIAAGCVAFGPDAREAAETDAIVAETVAAARLPGDARRIELSRAQENFDSLADDASRLRLAALLATLPAPERDDARAAALLAPLVARRPETPYTRLAALLAAQLAERQRLAAERQRLAAERQRLVAEQQRLVVEQKRLAAEHQRLARSGAQREAALKDQIEALKAIERGVLEREERLQLQAR
jgi:hypothetical protein